MHLTFNGDAHLLSRLVLYILVSTDKGNTKVIASSGSVMPAGCKSRRNCSAGGLVNDLDWVISVQEVKPFDGRGKYSLSSRDKYVNSSWLPVFGWSLSVEFL